MIIKLKPEIKNNGKSVCHYLTSIKNDKDKLYTQENKLNDWIDENKDKIKFIEWPKNHTYMGTDFLY